MQMTPGHSKYFQGPFIAIQKVWFICCNVTAAMKNILAVPKTSFDKGSMSINRILVRTYARKHNEGNLATGKPVPQASFFSHFFDEQHGGNFLVSIRIINGADNVYSLRRKELFWQYKLGTFSPAGLNERAADIELINTA